MMLRKLKGRKTKYTTEIAQLICYRIATSSVGIKKLCAYYNDMPSHDTIYKWLWLHQEFSDQYLAAKTLQMDLILDECEELADNIMYYADSLGNKRIDPASVKIQIAKINQRKWHASKLLPKNNCTYTSNSFVI